MSKTGNEESGLSPADGGQAPKADGAATRPTVHPADDVRNVPTPQDKSGPEVWADFAERDGRQPVPLEVWVAGVVPDTDLWQALLQAVADELGLPSTNGVTRSPRTESGIVVADLPILALVAAAVLSPQAQLLQSARERSSARQRLQDALNADIDIARFLQRSRRQPTCAGGWVMRCWDQPGLQAAAESALADPANQAMLATGLLCLQHVRHFVDYGGDGWGSQALLPVRADLSRNWKSILGRVLCALPLPTDIRNRHCADPQAAQELIDDLLEMGISGDQLLQGLNTPQFADFQRLVHRLHAAESPQQHALFERYVLVPDEAHPRHAASLFLAAHFTELTPKQFIDLGDLLVANTPSSLPASDARRPPAAITDPVLSQCEVRFIRTKQGGVVVGLAAADSVEPGKADRLNMGAAEVLCALFEREAPLLKERYLQCMGEHLVFGHPSDAVADRYLRLEVVALGAAAAGEGYSAGERLRRIVYGAGPTALVAAAGDTAPPALTGRHDALFRAMERAPELLATFAGDDDQALHDALVELCSAPALGGTQSTNPLTRMAMSGVFWTTYAQMPTRLSLRAFPAFFSDELPDAALFRDDALTLLRRMLGAPDATGWFGPTEAPVDGLATLLMADTLRCFDDILDSGPRGLDIAMLVESALAHLERRARGVPWSVRPPWSTHGGIATGAPQPPMSASPGANGAGDPLDLALAQIITSPRWIDWLHNPRTRLSSSSAQPVQRNLDDEGLLQLRIVRSVIDAWIGLSAFDRWEAAALNVWFRRALDSDVRAVGRLRFYDRWYWRCLMNPQPQVEADELCQRLMRGAVAPLLDSFGLLLLMVVTHAPAPTTGRPPRFMFSDALTHWLTRIELPDTSSPAQNFLVRLEKQVGPFQTQWEQAHREVSIVGELDLKAIRDAYADARHAVQAFAAALQPLAKASRPLRNPSAAPPPAPPA